MQNFLWAWYNMNTSYWSPQLLDTYLKTSGPNFTYQTYTKKHKMKMATMSWEERTEYLSYHLLLLQHHWERWQSGPRKMTNHCLPLMNGTAESGDPLLSTNNQNKWNGMFIKNLIHINLIYRYLAYEHDKDKTQLTN